MRVRAFAKINRSLRIVGVRPDGYHELRTEFQSIALHDSLTLRATRGPFRLTCDEPACPSDATNLVSRAAGLVWAAAGRDGAPRGVSIELTKRIPLCAGLGGGSSDAAAALGALGKLWRVGRATLQAIAPSLGADVPYFLEGGRMLGVDRGDTLERLRDGRAAWVVLVIPAFGVSTTDAYAWWDAAEGSPRARPRRAISRRGTRVGLPQRGNDLQPIVAKRHPEIGRIVTALRKVGASEAAMSGSGSAVFGLFAREAAAFEAASVLLAPGRRALVTRTLDRAAYQRLAGW